MSIEIDKTQWSESSRRSEIYNSTATEYEGIGYVCIKCSAPTVFTAREQKVAYEVKKDYIWKRRTLCRQCFVALEVLRKRARSFQKSWNEGREVLVNDRVFVEHWLNALEEIRTYGKRSDDSAIVRLRRLLHEMA